MKKAANIILFVFTVFSFSYLIWQCGRYYGYKEGYKQGEFDNHALRRLDQYDDIQYGVLNELLKPEKRYSAKIGDIVVNLKRVEK